LSLKETKNTRFLEWIRETVEAEEKAELKQKIRDLELENESLREFSQQQSVENEITEREELEKDTMLDMQAEVLSDMLADEKTERRITDAMDQYPDGREDPPEAESEPTSPDNNHIEENEVSDDSLEETVEPEEEAESGY